MRNFYLKKSSEADKGLGIADPQNPLKDFKKSKNTKIVLFYYYVSHW